MALKNKYKLKYRKWKKRARGKLRRQSFQTRVKRVMMKAAETKYYDLGEENVNLYHNLGYSAALPVVGGTKSIPTLFNCWSLITQGAGRQNRIGDKITPRGMSLKIWFANKDDSPNVMYRVLIVRAPKAIAGFATTFDIDPFQTVNLGANNNKLQLPVDQDRGFRALYDRVISLEKGTSGTAAGVNKECHKQIKIWIKRKNPKPIVYNAGAAQDIANNPLLFYIIPYDSFGTLFSDKRGSVAYWCRMYYKDV